MRTNYAFIDGNNLYRGFMSQEMTLDYGRFRLYLRNALNVKKAFLFIGYIPENTDLYSSLQSAGFTLVFKPTVPYSGENGPTVKGNVDAELVLHAAAIEYDNYDKAVLVSSDGDFACLVKYLRANNKLAKIITPTATYSVLLRSHSDYILPLKTIERSVCQRKNRHSRSVQEP